MNKKIKLILLSVIIFIIAISTKAVYATNTTATLNVDNENVKAGDTFTVTFTASCEDGINGVITEIEYDSDKLELIELKSADANKWTNLGTGLNVEIIHANDSTETESNIFTTSFKVKDEIEDESITILAKNIEIDSDTSVTPIDLGTKQISVTVAKVETQEENNTIEESNEGTVKTITAGTKSTDSTTSKTLPTTGIKTISVVAVGMIIVLAIVFYLEYKRYRGI